MVSAAEPDLGWRLNLASIAAAEGTLRVWPAQSGEAVLTLPFPAQVYGARFSPDGTTLAFPPVEGRVVLIDVPAPSDSGLPARR
jgi:hypothetical protein